MNVFNSELLLVALFVCSILSPSFAINDTLSSDKKPITKEIIIVNFDSELDAQLTGLSEYVYSIYTSQEKPHLTITLYSTDEDNASTINNLVDLLSAKGVSKSSVEILTENPTASNPYFSLSIGEIADVQ